MIIGLTGKSGAGKDAVASFLCQDPDFIRIAFADKLKEAAREIFGFRWEQLHGRERDTLDPYWQMAPSTLLQLLGTECVRNGFADTVIGKDVWVKAAMRGMIPRESYVFTDVRYTNEAKALTDLGGTILRVNRPGHVSMRAPHISETAMDNYPCPEIINDGTLEELRAKVIGWLNDNS